MHFQSKNVRVDRVGFDGRVVTEADDVQLDVVLGLLVGECRGLDDADRLEPGIFVERGRLLVDVGHLAGAVEPGGELRVDFAVCVDSPVRCLESVAPSGHEVGDLGSVADAVLLLIRIFYRNL